VDPEPGEVVFFHGHPTWLSLTPFYVKGLLLSVAAGVLAGIVTAVAVGHVQSGWVVAAVLVVFVVMVIVGLLRRIQTTYSITSRRLTIETGLLSKRLHQTRLERVQNVNCTQSLMGRLARVGTVDFDTAGESEFDFSFHGVHDPRGIVRTVDRALHERLTDGDPRTSAGV
jgi:uncharacterized membrane protein YdbT with pleckstrin-like domain